MQRSLCILCGENLVMIGFPLWDGVITARMKWMAFTDSFHPEPKAIEHTMLLQRINAIVRTAGMEPAALPQPWADRHLVQADQLDGRLCR
jgi:hypothetical protein